MDTTIKDAATAHYVLSLGQAMPSDREWRILAMRLGHVPTRDEECAFVEAWREQHDSWLDLRKRQELDP